MTSLVKALEGVSRLGFDTAPIIYFVEEHPRYLPQLAPAFQSVAAGQLIGITSVLTLAEVLVQPIRLGAESLQQAYTDRLLHSANFVTRPIDATVARRAADLRARHNLRVPDAQQLATVMAAGCEAFLTNDTQFKRVTGIRVSIVDELS